VEPGVLVGLLDERTPLNPTSSSGFTDCNEFASESPCSLPTERPWSIDRRRPLASAFAERPDN
jgi:hypothetical protein